MNRPATAMYTRIYKSKGGWVDTLECTYEINCILEDLSCSVP